jgi:hypothetical protein
MQRFHSGNLQWAAIKFLPTNYLSEISTQASSMTGTGNFFRLPSGGVRLTEELRFSGLRPQMISLDDGSTLGTADGASNPFDFTMPVTKNPNLLYSQIYLHYLPKLHVGMFTRQVALHRSPQTILDLITRMPAQRYYSNLLFC